jgi:hydroxyacylglutathione hydrolase
VEIIQFVAEALGDSSYLAVSGSEAVAVDPQRDVRPYVAAAEERGARITTVLETHVHNDYLSGGRELAALGAKVVLPADSGVEFPHRGVRDGDEVRVGSGTLRAVFTPGHTHHHTSYVAIDEGGAVAGAFTGGSIIIGGAGRTDLLGESETEQLTRMQWESAQRLIEILGEQSEVLPTHGAGSFCSVSGVSERRATLAEERPRNIVLTSPDFESFRTLHLASPGPIPSYYRHMAPINRSGPAVYGTPPVPALLTPDALRAEIEAGARALDVRPRRLFSQAHIPGSLGIEDTGSLLAYLSWMTPFNATLVLVTQDAPQAERITTDLFRIGYEEVRGYLPFEAWTAGGGAVAAFDTVGVLEAAALARNGVPHLDVRFGNEIAETPIDGARPLPFEEIAEWMETLDEERVLLTCSSGLRASAAASLLQARGVRPIVLIEGGAGDLIAHAREHGHT